MKQKAKYFSVGGILLVMGLAGGWFVLDAPTSEQTKPIVVDETILPPDIKPEDKSVRAKVIASVYKTVQEYQYVTDSGELKTPKIDKKLKEEIDLENHPYPLVSGNQVEPEMTKILQEVLSRKDGSTNNTDENRVQVVEENVFKDWKQSFELWSKGRLTKKEFIQRWNLEKKESTFSGLSKPTVVSYTFPYSQSTIKMIDSVLKEVEKQGASTAPHISFVSVTFDENSSSYSLYFAESHIE